MWFQHFLKINLTKISAPLKKIIIFVKNVDVTQVNMSGGEKVLVESDR